MCGVVVDSFDLGECGEVIGFRVKLGLGFCRGRGVPTHLALDRPYEQYPLDLLHTHTILYQPFVDSFCRMRHEDAASEVGLRQDKGETHSMVKMETVTMERLAHVEPQNVP